jgi:hypothetical protein
MCFLGPDSHYGLETFLENHVATSLHSLHSLTQKTHLKIQVRFQKFEWDFEITFRIRFIHSLTHSTSNLKFLFENPSLIPKIRVRVWNCARKVIQIGFPNWVLKWEQWKVCALDCVVPVGLLFISRGQIWQWLYNLNSKLSHARF